MHLHGLPHYFSKAVHHRHPESAVLYHTSSLDVWPSELADKPDRFITKIESCSAHTMTAGHDGCPGVVNKEHHHTFLRVTLAPTKDHPEDTVFVERVLTEQGRATHSVIPVAADVLSLDGGDTLHDHACMILEGSPSALIHGHHLKIDRTIHFSRCPDRQLSLYELATLLRFISAHGLRAVSIGLDTACETYSKWFSRATMSALAPVIMRGSFRELTPPKHEAGVQVEISMQRSVDAWLSSTFKTYPIEAVAAENLVRFAFLWLAPFFWLTGRRNVDEANERNERGRESEKDGADF